MVNKKDRDRRRRSRRRQYKRGKVYDGNVEEEEEDEEDEHEAYKPAREYDEPLKEPQKVGIETLLYFLKNTLKIRTQSILM